MSDISGVLPVDKPVGPTSHDIVAIARRALGTRRIGHTGTLDPFASGLLLLCLGPATRLAEYLTGLSKRYVATIRLGVATDTDDHTGAVVGSTEAWRDLDPGDVRAAVAAQVGTLDQLPPAYSAKKVGGERMYAAARRGEPLERTAVRVTIHSIELLRMELPELEIDVRCGSGTYVRAIARDIGEALGVGAHLSALRRTAIGDHQLDDAIPVDRLQEADAVHAALLSPAAAMSHLPMVRLNPDDAARVAHGGFVAHDPTGRGDLPEGATLGLTGPSGELVAIAELRGATIRPRKVFA